MDNPITHNFFRPTDGQVKLFQLIMNGQWWSLTRLVRSIGKTLYDEEHSRQLLSEAVENAAIQRGHAMIEKEQETNPPAPGWTECQYVIPLTNATFAEAIVRGLPIPEHDSRSHRLARGMLLTLRQHLAHGEALLIDGGWRITLEQGRFVLAATIKNIEIPESDCTLEPAEQPYTDKT